MYCEQCGKKNEDNRRYCFNCGSPLVEREPGTRRKGGASTGSNSAVAGAKHNPSYYSRRGMTASEELSSWQKRQAAMQQSVKQQPATDSQMENQQSENQQTARIPQIENQQTAGSQQTERQQLANQQTASIPKLENPQMTNQSAEQTQEKRPRRRSVSSEPVSAEELAAMEEELRQLQGGKNSESKKRKKEKRENVLAAALAAVTLLAFVFLLTLLLKKLPELYGAKQEAAGFETAMLSGKWDTAYQYLDLDTEENPYLGEGTFASVMGRTGASGYRDLIMKELTEEDVEGDTELLPYLQNPEKKVFLITWKAGEEIQQDCVILTRTGEKKLLIVDEWRVDPVTLCAKNVSIEIPAEAELLLNGEVVTLEPTLNQDKNTATYQFDTLFCGDWKLELNAENREPYATVVTVSKSEENDTISLAGAELYPNQALKDQAVQQFAQDYQAILVASLNRADFSMVQNYFAEAAVQEGRAENMYKNACSQAYDPATGMGILSYELRDVQAVFVPVGKSGFAQKGDLVMEIHSTMTYRYLEYGIEKIDTQNSVGLLCYHQENGQWKIQSFS